MTVAIQLDFKRCVFLFGIAIPAGAVIGAAKSDEERKKIDAEFQPKHEKMAAQFLALGKANLKAEFAFTALMMATQDNTTDKEAFKLVVDHFADDEKIL